jgi:hypothetical protein
MLLFFTQVSPKPVGAALDGSVSRFLILQSINVLISKQTFLRQDLQESVGLLACQNPTLSSYLYIGK